MTSSEVELMETALAKQLHLSIRLPNDFFGSRINGNGLILYLLKMS